MGMGTFIHLSHLKHKLFWQLPHHPGGVPEMRFLDLYSGWIPCRPILRVGMGVSRLCLYGLVSDFPPPPGDGGVYMH